MTSTSFFEKHFNIFFPKRRNILTSYFNIEVINHKPSFSSQHILRKTKVLLPFTSRCLSNKDPKDSLIWWHRCFINREDGQRWEVRSHYEWSVLRFYSAPESGMRCESQSPPAPPPFNSVPPQQLPLSIWSGILLTILWKICDLRNSVVFRQASLPVSVILRNITTETTLWSHWLRIRGRHHLVWLPAIATRKPCTRFELWNFFPPPALPRWSLKKIAIGFLCSLYECSSFLVRISSSM